MPTPRPSLDLQLHYLVDDFTNAWIEPEATMSLHGNAESSLVRHAWMSRLARRFRVVRPEVGSRIRLRVRTTASPISRMGTSVEDGCRGV